MNNIVITTHLSMKEFIKVNYYLSYKRWSMRLITFIGLLSIILWIIGYASVSALISGLILIVIIPSLLYFSFRRNYQNKNNRISEPITYTFSNDMIECQGESFKSSFTWDKIHMIAESKSWILLYQNKLAANIIPKERISKEDIIRLKSIIDNYKSVKNNLK